MNNKSVEYLRPEYERGHTHSWSKWYPDTGTLDLVTEEHWWRYKRECTISGCTAFDLVEDLEEKGGRERRSISPEQMKVRLQIQVDHYIEYYIPFHYLSPDVVDVNGLLYRFLERTLDGTEDLSIYAPATMFKVNLPEQLFHDED